MSRAVDARDEEGPERTCAVTRAKGDPATMQLDPHYDDVVGEVSTWLEL